MSSKFLTARWEYLLMANYEVDANTLLEYLPKDTEIDFWQGKTYLSVVGFMFLNTKVLGFSIPFHQNFEEINLRFYVKYFDKKEEKWKRGVVFIKEIVPKIAIASVARWVYGENYFSRKTSHIIQQEQDNLLVEYSWKEAKKLHKISAIAHQTPIKLSAGSEEEFITEHYWGYTKGTKRTLQYQVEHPKWDIFPIKTYDIQVDFEQVYGKHDFTNALYQNPTSVLLAKGSEISVYKGTKI